METAANTIWKTESQIYFFHHYLPRFRDCLIPNEIQPLDCKIKYEKFKTTGKEQEEHTL